MVSGDSPFKKEQTTESRDIRVSWIQYPFSRFSIYSFVFGVAKIIVIFQLHSKLSLEPYSSISFLNNVKCDRLSQIKKKCDRWKYGHADRPHCKLSWEIQTLSELGSINFCWKGCFSSKKLVNCVVNILSNVLFGSVIQIRFLISSLFGIVYRNFPYNQ